MATKKSGRDNGPGKNVEMPSSPASTTPSEHAFNQEVSRSKLQTPSPVTPLERWPADQLKRGVALQRQALQEHGSKRLKILREAIRAFEAALGVYGKCQPAPTSSQNARAEPCKNTADADPADLLLKVTSGPFIGDVQALEMIVELLQARCSEELRRTNVKMWAVNVVNFGCALTLLGKCESNLGDGGRLDEAIDTFLLVINEPRLDAGASERAIAHINMADALCAMGDLEFADQRLVYVEGALGSLAKALSIVAPEPLKCLVEDDQAGFA